MVGRGSAGAAEAVPALAPRPQEVEEEDEEEGGGGAGEDQLEVKGHPHFPHAIQSISPSVLTLVSLHYRPTNPPNTGQPVYLCRLQVTRYIGKYVGPFS